LELERLSGLERLSELERLSGLERLSYSLKSQIRSLLKSGLVSSG
jgi:hypothetical protein